MYRAGGLAWLGRGSHTAKVKGSSPFPPIIIYWYECVQLQAEDRVYGT